VELSDFQVDGKGRIADYKRNHQPIAEVVQPGNGRSYVTPDHEIKMRVLAFRRFNIDGGNLSTVFTVTNRGKRAATLGKLVVRAAGRERTFPDYSFSIAPGATSTEPLSAGPDQLPADVTLKVTLSGQTSKTVAIPVPAFA
jgi:hypothetical protein